MISVASIRIHDIASWLKQRMIDLPCDLLRSVAFAMSVDFFVIISSRVFKQCSFKTELT